MSNFKCVDIASTIIDELSIRLGSDWVVDKELYANFELFCNDVDVLVDECWGKSLNIFVEESNKDIFISIECNSITVQEPNHVFYRIVDKSRGVAFKLINEDAISATFIFPSIWKKMT